MKAKFSFFFFGFVIFMSCSNNLDKDVNTSNVETFDKSETFADLNYRLDEYNRQLGIQKNVLPQTRGKFWSTLWKVTKADFLGAFIGAGGGGIANVINGGKPFSGNVVLYSSILGAVVASLDAAGGCQIVVPSNSDGINSYDAAVVFGSFAVSEMDSVGYYPNKLIKEILEETPNLLTKGKDEMQYLTKKKIQECFGLSSQEIEEIAGLCNEVRIEVEDFDKLKATYPKLADEINISEKYFTAIANLSTDAEIQAYTQGFRDIVVSSNIPQNSMNVIQASTSVAANSHCLWKIEE